MKLYYKLSVVLLAIALVFLAGCSNNEKAMVDAVKNGDTAKVQSLLDRGVSPNLKTDAGQTILMLAAYQGHTDIAKLLIEKGADVNAKDNNGKTALMYAAEKGYVEMAKLLLEKGADINAVDNNGKTALQIAQDNNQTEMAEFLSKWGKPVSTPVPTVSATATPTPISTPTPLPTETPTPIATSTPAPAVSANKQLTSVFFDFDESVLRSDQTGTMEENLAILKDNPNMHIILGGHADERGTREYNLALSEWRAKTIQKYLIDNGIAPERIIIYAYGKDYPLKKGHDEASRSYNRRVDILEWDTVLTKEQVIDKTIK
jgi:outer membrane protein OmpA-like peptidoglycan-associated protein